jgi:hypothetical protein
LISSASKVATKRSSTCKLFFPSNRIPTYFFQVFHRNL